MEKNEWRMNLKHRLRLYCQMGDVVVGSVFYVQVIVPEDFNLFRFFSSNFFRFSCV